MTSKDDAPPGKAYSAPGITVYFNPRRCIHFGACVRGLPAVFEKARRPWIMADAAPVEAVAAGVPRCPTGALHYVLEDGPREEPDAQVRVEPRLNGPLFVRGDVVVETATGPVRDLRMALCRCGRSGNKPFCDGSHARTEWQSDEPAT